MAEEGRDRRGWGSGGGAGRIAVEEGRGRKDSGRRGEGQEG